MRLRLRLLLIAAAVVALLLAPVSVAAASHTSLTVTVQSGSLAISVPEAADLGIVDPATTASGQIGSVTVTDERAQLTASWTASVSADAFTTGGASPEETIPTSDVRYWSGLATATSGVGVFTPAQPLPANAVTLSTDRTAFTLTAGVGNNSASWNPTVLVDVPADAVAGVYTGAVTHTVL
ncbi:hypothetical protein L0U85_14390 [Glycomyces sp. L485]|uniref:hypothetical protein n=1 Tax=Glycomyces sp. L485 TaxID=2909235 RepID=UPI001F4A330C|nr:hypothetical protein [Glycomyces sp. L485]MCH7232035.1 hypothetical protein [Glycomyces sp. L485]